MLLHSFLKYLRHLRPPGTPHKNPVEIAPITSDLNLFRGPNQSLALGTHIGTRGGRLSCYFDEFHTLLCAFPVQIKRRQVKTPDEGCGVLTRFGAGRKKFKARLPEP